MESRRFLFLLFGSTGGLVSGWLFCTIMLPVLPCSLATLTSRWGHPLTRWGATCWGRWIRPGHQLSIPQEYGLGDQTFSLVPSLCQALGSTWLKFGASPSRLRDITFSLPGDSAEIPTVTRDIIYGWARGLVGPLLLECFSPTTFVHKAANTTGKKVELVGKAPFFFELKW